MKKLCICIAFVLSALYLSAQRTSSALDFYNQAKERQNKRDWYAAVELYQEALKLNPSYGEAWFSLGECSYELGQYDLAVQYCDTAAKYIKNRTDVPNYML